MLKWFSGEEGESVSGDPGSSLRVSGAGEVPAEEMAERLSQTEQLVSQLKELIREKDAALRAKDDQLKVEKEACEAKLSKLRLQNKAKVTSLTSQLEDLKKQNGGANSPIHNKKGVSESGDQANRGKIVLLKKKVEDLEQQLAKSKEELSAKRKELESQWQRGEEMDKMLTEKDRKLAEKEAYIVHLQTALAGDQPSPQPMEAQDLQTLVQNLTKKIGEAEERYSLLQEQTDSLKELLSSEKEQYSQKENMYKQNIQTFKDIILQKDNQLMEMNQMHEQELFKLAAKSDASADLEQLLKALKQKLHEKEEVLLGKTQVIDVFQGEVDARDEQIKELTERLKRLQVEQKSLESKMEAEKHVMRAQIRDLMEKQQSEVQHLTEQHQAELAQTQRDVLVQLEELRRVPAVTSVTAHEKQAADSTSSQRIADLEAKAKEKAEEASKSEAKFLKMKAWSKSRIRQLEDELKKSQAGTAPPELTLLRSQVTALEEEREENLWKVEQYEELKSKNEMLEGKLVVYEEQQRTLQADLEQFTKRAASQASESGSADDTQSQVLEWQEMVAEAVSARDRAREEKSALALRINHLEEEKEGLIEDDWFFPGCSDPALASRQQELEEELAQTRGLGPHRTKKLGPPAERSLQEDFEFDSHTPFQEPCSPSESTTQMEGENMGDGLKSVVEELELERNQLQEQILSLEERCQDLEDRLQLQARIETLQNETEKLQSQLASVRSQQSREAEKHQLLVSSLNEQLKGLSDTQECLESSLIEKENTLAKTSEKLELISNLRESLREKEIQYKEMSDKLLLTEHTLEDVSKKCSNFEKQCCELKTEVADLTQKLSTLKEKAQKQEVAIETLQTELDQTNEELDKLNTAHLEERAQLIYDLQSCEREIDNLKDTLCEKEKEIATLSSNVIEYSEQITELKQEIKLKEENLVQVENALSKTEREAKVLRDSQSSDQQLLNGKISQLVEKLKDCEIELNKTKEERDLNGAEVEQLIKQTDEDKKTIQYLRMDVQKQTVNHRNHLSECETHITSLKEQLSSSNHQLKEAEEVISQLKEEMQQELKQKEHMYDSELKSFKDEQNSLLVKVEKYNIEVQTLSKQLEERLQSEEHVRLEMQGKHNIIKSLEKQMEEERTKYSSELQERDLANQKMSSELQSKAENVSKLKSLLKNLKTEKGQLQEKLKSYTEELKVEMETVKQLNEKVATVSELNNNLEKQTQCLTEEKAKLEQQIMQHVNSISELTAEKDNLNAKITQVNTMYSENLKTIEMLRKEKEDLTFQTNDLNRVLKQSTHSNSEILLAKTNECSHLGQLLRQKEEEATRLQENVANLSSTVTQLEQDLVKKDCFVADLRANTKALQKQQKHLQEALVVLEERERSLKSEATQNQCVLKEKQTECERLQKEIDDQKIIVSKLQTETDAVKKECISLCSQIEAKEELLQNLTEQNAKHKNEINDANNLVVSLRAQVTAMEENVRKLELEIQCKQTELVSSQSAIQSALEDNLNLCNSVKSKENKLANVEEQLKEVLEQHASLNMQLISLSDHNKSLQEELDHKTSELNTEKSLLQDLEGQKLNNQKVIDGLIKEKEELTVTVFELNKALKQNESLNSEKTNEYANLLREKEQCVHSLQEEVNKLKIEGSQLNLAINEKEQSLLEQKNQLLQLEDTVAMLQEQGSLLKSALMEKDTMLNQKTSKCDSYHKEVGQQKEIISQLQADIDSLQEECRGMKKDMVQKDQTLQAITNELQSHKDELKKRNESVLSLSSQLGAINKNAAEMETELANLKAALQKLTSENAQLMQEGEQKKAKMIDFEDSIQVLNEQNERLKTELLKTVTDLSEVQDKVESYKTAVNDKERQISALAEELNAEKERLNLTVHGNDDILKQQKELVHQLNSRITEQEDELKRKTNENVDLVTQVSELEKTLEELRIQVDNLTSESSVLKATLENKEKASLEYENTSYATLEKLNINLTAKEAECDSLKERISHLEESISKLNSTLQVHISETETLQKALGGKEAVLSEQSKRIQDLQRKADEALLFKTQFTESTELVSQLQRECEGLRKSAEETQSAFSNLQEKYAAHLEELQNVRNKLSQEVDEASSLRKLLEDHTSKHQDAQNTIGTLKNELSMIRQQLQSAQELNSTLAKEKVEALASHQSNVSMLTVEIERLKSQHLQVVAQMDALTENIEQREMALHAINSQYTAQAKQLVSQIQTLEEHNNKLRAEISLSKEDDLKQITLVNNENAHLQEHIRKLVEEKEDLEKRWRQNEGTQVQMEQQSSSLTQTVERLVSEKEILQAKVSAKEEEISQLKENVEKLEEILQDSEKEWLLVLNKEKQDRNLITEQLICVENEIKCKDVKVGALKEDLDHLQEKLSEAVLAVMQGSEQLRAKEMEASMSKSQLENVLASIQEKDHVNSYLQQTLDTVESQLQQLVVRNDSAEKHTFDGSNEKCAYLLDMIKDLQQRYQSELDALKNNLNETVAKLKQTESVLNDREKADLENCQQIALLQESVNHLQTQLNAESENVKEAAVKHSSLHSEVQTKEEYISCMNVQITQQKELLAGLSQQLKDKDASIAQVMESAANERVRLTEENSSLKELLEKVENAHKSSTEKCKHISQQFEMDIVQMTSQIDTKNLEISEMCKRNHELKSDVAKLVKEKDTMKKKLQAALVVRKDLMKKIEHYESQNEENVSNKSQVSLLNDKLQKVQNQAQAAEKKYQENVSALKQKEKELLQYKAETEGLMTGNQNLQAMLNEKELCLAVSIQNLNEKNSFIEQLQASLTEKENAFEREKRSWMLKIEELQNEMKTCRDEKESTTAASSTSFVDLESELAQMKLDKAMQQKKTQAAMLARKETMKKAQESEKKLTQELAELKDHYKALLEQQCQQTNELNAVQLNFDEKVRELEELCKTSLSYLDELDTLRQLLVERDEALQDLKMALAEKESQCHSLSKAQTELETVKSNVESTSLKMANKEQALIIMKQKVEELESKLLMVQNDLEKAQREVEVKTEDAQKYLEKMKILERRCEQEKQSSDSAIEQRFKENEHKYHIIIKENKELLEKHDQLKMELETALALGSQKASEILTLQKSFEETQQSLNQDKEVMAKKLEEVNQDCAQMQRNLDLEKQKKESVLGLINKLKDEMTLLTTQLNESQKQNVQLQERTAEMANFEVMLTEKEDAMLEMQAHLLEKHELIASLELQLSQQMKMHDMAIEKMKTEANEVQKSSEDATKMNAQESKIGLLTKKLQAALVSRKELQRGNATLKEELEKLSAKYEEKQAKFSVLEYSVLKLNHQNSDLETSVATLNVEKDNLRAEVDRILNDNCSLSNACESLKQTIENITQQKQAFSCQLESLKDSQTEELSDWKLKHSELKQEYESLLQAYENVSSEMDKMRQHLEGAKRERQEAISKVHKHEAELENRDRQVREIERENEKLKESFQILSQDKLQKIEELEAESKKIGHLEVEVGRLLEMSEDLRKKVREMEAENEQMVEKLKEVNCSLEKKQIESNSYAENMQRKLDEALRLSNSLTVQIDAQKTELNAQLEISQLLQKEKQSLTEQIDKIQNEHELELGKKDEAIQGLNDIITQHRQETISLNEKVRILEDDKSLLQEELENAQEISDKVKNENEYLETVILKNSEKIDELTEFVSTLQSQKAHLSSQLKASSDISNKIQQEKEEEQLKLVKEFEEKLKMVQRGNEGTKNVKKELRELLKEKHQEIILLQQNCIKYQEVILDLESSLKTSQSACEHSENELKQRVERISFLEERSKQLESELITTQSLLGEAKERALSVYSERDQLALELLQQCQKRDDEKILPIVEETHFFVENQVLQQQIEDLKMLNNVESQKVNELQQQIDSQDLQIAALKQAVETNEAKLTALTSTPQGADATKLWNNLYQKALHEKDNQLLEQGFVIKRFLEDIRTKDKEVNELRVTKSRLERTLNEYSMAASAHQRQLFVMSASNTELNETLEMLSVQVKELTTQVERIEQDKNMLNKQLADKEELISQMQLKLQQSEKLYVDSDAQMHSLQAQNDKLQAEFEKQEGISLQLKNILQSKNSEISSLLSCKDGQMSGYLEQLQANYRSQISVYEDRLTSARYQREKSSKELRSLEAKVKSLQIQVGKTVQEKDHMAAKMESLKNSLASLQSERERLMSEYRILEAKSQLGLRAKEGSGDGEGGATKGLKHEIRKLLHQMDDLNSENAMLRAQLVRYREDLNQVLSLKDNQLKVLLKKQQDTIKTLENNKIAAEEQHRETCLELERVEKTSGTLKSEISKLKTEITKLEDERVMTNEGRVIADLQNAVATKATESSHLQQKLLFEKNLCNELKDKFQQLETETDNKLSEAEEKYNSELDNFERELNVMRNERETADQRVAELAKDLLEVEQQLSEARTQSKDAKTQNDTLCKAMAALQNDRDQLIEDFKILRNRYDEELRETQAALTKMERKFQDATSDLAMSAKQRDVLVHKVKAFETNDVQSELTKLVDELGKALSEKERQLKNIALENDTYCRQISAFSRSMASLQNDRDRLIDELAGAKRVFEVKQGSSKEVATFMSVDKSQNSAFQLENKELEAGQTLNDVEKEDGSSQDEMTVLSRSGQETKDMHPVTSGLEETVSHLEKERIRLHQDLQRCLFEIHQRDQYIHQFNTKLQQAVEEKGTVAAQLRTVSQTLRDTQNRCHWLETQVLVQTQQGAVYAEEAPGAPQERSSESVMLETTEATQLRDRLLELEQSFTEERARREAAEEALRIAEDGAKSHISRENQRDFSIEMEAEDEWEALSLNPNQPLITRKVKGGMVTCRRWLRGRSLYFSRLLTGRARSRYFFLAYLLTLHVLVLMCLTGAL